MTDCYIAFDVETPNNGNRRMSAIGIAVVERGGIVEHHYTLVNPESRFDPFHVRLTGITAEMVQNKPTFPELWPDLARLLDRGLLIAHNAPFDLSVLAKCLWDYGIHWRGTVSYACTCQMSRRLLPHLPNHKLDTLCDYLGFDLEHHNAGSDSQACGEILLHCLEKGADIRQFLRRYDLLHCRTISSRIIE